MTRVATKGTQPCALAPVSAAAPKADPDQLRMIPELLAHGAEAYGFRGEVWTGARVRGSSNARFAVTFTQKTRLAAVESLAWTPQVPAERAPNAMSNRF